MLTIWGRLNSVNVQKVVFAARELGLDFRRIDAGGPFGMVGTAEYRAMNPNALVPVIDDDGFVLWESNAIVRYLATRYGMGTLCPEPLTGRADADRWMDWQSTTLQPAMGPAFMQLVRTPAGQRQDALVDESARRTEPLLAILDAHLAGRDWIVGERFTMADVVLGCAVHRWFGLPLPQPRAARPQVERWYAQLMRRPAAEGVLTLPLT